MHLFGLTPIQLLSFLGASVLVVAALYRLKLRRRTVVVSFARLWRKVVRDRPATSLFERLRRLVSLLLQLAFVGLVLLAIARPRLSTDAERERRFVIVIDGSAAMQARTDVASGAGRTRLDEAREFARTLVGRLGETDRAMVIRAGVSPEPRTAFETDRRVLLDAVERLEADDCRSNLGDAVRFARRLVPGAPGRVFVFTSSPPDAALPLVAWRRVGRPVENVAITCFAARPALESPGEYELLFEVRNFAGTDADVRLRIDALVETPTLIEDRPLKLVPGGRVSGVIRGIARTDMKLHARLTRNDGSELRDGLPLDDEAFAFVPAPRVTKVTVVGKENFFLESVLKSDPLIQWRRIGVAEYTGKEDADVVIFDNCVPTPSADRAIYIHPTGPGAPVRSSATIRDAFVDRLAGDHPVMRFVGRPADLSIAESEALVPGEGDVVLASCAGTPVMLARARQDRRLVVLGFDLTSSDLVLRVAFPKLFRNAIHWIVSGEVRPEGGAFLTGERVVLDAPGERVELCGPDGGSMPLAVTDGRVNFVPGRVGFYQVSGRAIPVNMSDEAISDLYSVSAPEEKESSALSLTHASVGWELWPILAGVALVLALSEWVSYHRRWTV
jgi:hypothetical protein